MIGRHGVRRIKAKEECELTSQPEQLSQSSEFISRRRCRRISSKAPVRLGHSVVLIRDLREQGPHLSK